jgi:hypothetical protein
MKKKDYIYRDILYTIINNKTYNFTQKDLALKFGFSFSTVFNALSIPRRINAIDVKSRGFTVCDVEKFLYFWATVRNLKKDIIYSTHYDGIAFDIEGLMPQDVIYTAYSAYRMLFKDVPSDYDKVYVYAFSIEEIKKRFPYKKGYQNVNIIKADKYLKTYGSIAPIPQIFVDLWNMKEWYAKEFVTSLKEKINGLLE